MDLLWERFVQVKLTSKWFIVVDAGCPIHVKIEFAGIT